MEKAKNMNKLGLLLFLALITAQGFSQVKNFIDLPYIETVITVDTLITPDKITLTIMLNEADEKNKKSTEELEKDMEEVLNSLEIDTEKNLTLLDFSSDFKKYFMSGQNVLKIKNYSLIVGNAVIAGKVLAGLENAGISNVSISKTEYTDSERLLLELKSKAILKAKINAEYILNPVNQKVGKVIHVTDVNSIDKALQGKVAGVQIRGTSSIYGSRASEPMMIDFDKITYSVSINVKFMIE